MQKTNTTVITGSLGAGKTTIILNLIKQLPKDYKVIWLKNEYGDLNIDSELAKESNIQTQEILNGCLCCVLIGKLKNAVEEIVNKYNPDRLIIETAGTAYPYPIIHEISAIDKVNLDGLVTVIDALNFKKFDDKSPMAKAQAQYIDLIIINKINLVTTEELELVEDEIYDLYPLTPKIKTANGVVGKDIILGIDHKNFATYYDKNTDTHPEVEVFGFEFKGTHTFDRHKLEKLLNNLDKNDFYRIKGVIKTQNGYKLLNYVLGKISWNDLKKYRGSSKITFMGRDITIFKEQIQQELYQIA